AQLRELQQADRDAAAAQAAAQEEAQRQQLEQIVESGGLMERERAAKRASQSPLQQVLNLDADARALQTAEQDAAANGDRLSAMRHQAGYLEAANLFNAQLPA
ncbi:hypothetical protein RZS08_24905, partial [Arthrospira platensis SPKY1]|nr:hypothetical protein [Arthrospira platensis SPKY1]